MVDKHNKYENLEINMAEKGREQRLKSGNKSTLTIKTFKIY